MSIFMMLIFISVLQALIYVQFFEMQRKKYAKNVTKLLLEFIKFATASAAFLFGLWYIFSRLETIVVYLAMNAEELLAPERIEALKNMVLTYIYLSLDLSPTSIAVLSFMSFAYYAVLIIPGVLGICYFYSPPTMRSSPAKESDFVPNSPDSVYPKGKIFLTLCQLRN